MDDLYYLANLKLSGWVSIHAQTSTDIKVARKFSHAEAITYAKRQREAGAIVVPVRVSDMELIG